MTGDKRPPAPADTSDYVSALVASFLGWTLDAFDFFLVVVSLPAIARDFGKDIHSVALTITVTLAFRPVGAFLFGLLADRYGRRLPLMIDLIFFSTFARCSALTIGPRSTSGPSGSPMRRVFVNATKRSTNSSNALPTT